MSSTEQAPEPTMDEILASIRRIIADDDPNGGPPAASRDDDAGRRSGGRASAADEIASALESKGESGPSIDDILELTKEVGRAPAPPMAEPKPAQGRPDASLAPPPAPPRAVEPPPPPAAARAEPAPPAVTRSPAPDSPPPDSPPPPASVADVAAPMPSAAREPVRDERTAPASAPEADSVSALEAALSQPARDVGPPESARAPSADEPPDVPDFDFGSFGASPAGVEDLAASKPTAPPLSEAEAEASAENGNGQSVAHDDLAARFAAEVEAALPKPEPADEGSSAAADLLDSLDALAFEPSPAEPAPEPDAGAFPSAEPDAQAQPSETTARSAPPPLRAPDDEDVLVAEDGSAAPSPEDDPAAAREAAAMTEAPGEAARGAPVRSLEDSVKDLLRPMLREWLDDNMPRILEGAVRDELAAKNGRDD